jgi:23S rRNA (guanine745-N1)-methyltransferase
VIAQGLACSVRGCGLPLVHGQGSLRCPKGHSYDVARRGYVNLLQPQDRRAGAAGDSREGVAARRRLLEAGVGRTIIDALVRTAGDLDLPDASLVADLGSGTGDVLAAITAARPMAGIGIDLSTAAAGHAARRYPGLSWVVANADRRLPLLDACAALIVSMHGRRNQAECERVLAPGGFLLVAVPAPEDLIELRASIQRGDERDRVESLIAEHAPAFTVLSRQTAREQRRLERESLHDLLRVTYRGARHRVRPLVEALGGMEVTLASDIVLFAKPVSRRS